MSANVKLVTENLNPLRINVETSMNASKTHIIVMLISSALTLMALMNVVVFLDSLVMVQYATILMNVMMEPTVVQFIQHVPILLVHMNANVTMDSMVKPVLILTSVLLVFTNVTKMPCATIMTDLIRVPAMRTLMVTVSTHAIQNVILNKIRLVISMN